MAKMIRIISKRQEHTGIACVSERAIVVWGKAAEGDTVEELVKALSEFKQTMREQACYKTNADIIREVCNKMFPGSWDFVAQGGTIEL